MTKVAISAPLTCPTLVLPPSRRQTRPWVDPATATAGTRSAPRQAAIRAFAARRTRELSMPAAAATNTTSSTIWTSTSARGLAPCVDVTEADGEHGRDGEVQRVEPSLQAARDLVGIPPLDLEEHRE